MIADPIERKRAGLNARFQHLQAEEEHRERLRRVFGSNDGLAVLEWILQSLCHYWAPSLDPTMLGQYAVGRTLFHAVTLADSRIAGTLLERRRELAESERLREKSKLEKEI